MIVIFLVLRLIETAFAQATPSRPNIAAGTSQSTNFCLTQGQNTLKFPLMGMVYTALVRLTHSWLTTMNRSEVSGVIFLDLKKTFDLVDHNIMMYKLGCYLQN